MTARPSWDEVWFAAAEAVARRSKCVRRQVGCVLVTATDRICATGFNGAPAGWDDGDDARRCDAFCPRSALDDSRVDGTYDDCVTIHAEINALIHSDRRDREGGTAYCTTVPCYACAKALANSGLARVVTTVTADDTFRRPERSLEMLRGSGLEVVLWHAS